MARASFRAGVEWIALNDETAETDIEALSQLISVLLLADLFGKTPDAVAAAVRRYRVGRWVAGSTERRCVAASWSVEEAA